MKKTIILILFLVLIGIEPLFAVTYTDMYGEPDILLKGSEFSAYSGPVELDSLGQLKDIGWIVEDDAIWTAWANEWVEYETELTKGTWNIGLDVINHGNIGNNNWYNQFLLINSITNELLVIQASDDEIFNSFITVDIDTNDTYTIRYTWLNDKWDPANGLDANIKIVNVFADKLAIPVPEPASILMMLIGSLGLLGFKVKK